MARDPLPVPSEAKNQRPSLLAEGRDKVVQNNLSEVKERGHGSRSFKTASCCPEGLPSPRADRDESNRIGQPIRNMRCASPKLVPREDPIRREITCLSG